MEKSEKYKKLSYKIIIVSSVMIALGVLLGSFIWGTIYLGSLGAFGAMVGIVLYIYSQLIDFPKKSDE